jgi:hypothetical protein
MFARAKIALIVVAGSLAPPAETPVDAGGASLADVELEDPEAEFEPNNIKRLAADKPSNALSGEIMLHPSPPEDRHGRGGLVA